jgi:UDP-N-acetylglucosamine:LPS N-acetylglucosamine transferase
MLKVWISRMETKKNVIFVSSAGGHLSELLRLAPLFDSYNYVVITEKTPTSEALKEKYNTEYMVYGSRHYFLKYIFVFLSNIILSIKYILKYKPHTIVTTGAHTGGIMSFFGKLFGAKVIFIESLAKVDSLSMTGKNVYRFRLADKFYVQWEELTKKYKRPEYIGRLI